MWRKSLQGEVDTVQHGVHVRDQDVLCADDALTSFSHSQQVGEYLQRRETLKDSFHEAPLKMELIELP